MLVTSVPTKTYLDPSLANLEHLREFLTYTDLSAEFALKKFRNNQWLARKLTREEWFEQLNTLKEARRKCLLFEDAAGMYTYSGLAGALSKRFNLSHVCTVSYPEPGLVPWLKEPPPLRYYQRDSLKALLEIKHGAVSIGCHRKGQLVLMYNGSFKKVEEVVVGDQLMGPDSLPRNVLELKNGFDSMYKLETVNGQEMYVNGGHILSLRRTSASSEKSCFECYKPKENVLKTVDEYVGSSNKFKHLHKLYSKSVEFKEQSVTVPPYILGVLLGDGSMNVTTGVTSADPEIVEELKRYASEIGVTLRVSRDEKKAKFYLFSRKLSTKQANPLTLMLRKMGLSGVECGAKFVPKNYLVNSKKNRLEILAGLIDTDGSFGGGCYDYISKSKQLSEDVCFLARSLGMRATIKECLKGCQTGAIGIYHRVTISGDLSVVPVRVPRKRAPPRKQIKNCTSFGFKVEKVSDHEEHFGFVLDSDHLYLTDTFLVTHNTGLGKSLVILNLVKTLGLKTVIIAPLTSIARQLYQDFVKYLGVKYVGFFGGGKKEIKKLFTVAIAQSLTRVVPGSLEHEMLRQTQVFVADESHQTPADTLASVCLELFENATYRFFFSGTQIRNDGSGLLLDGIVGKIVYNMTVKEGVEQGYLAKPKFVFFRLNSPDPKHYDDPNKSTRKHLFYNPKVTAHAAKLANLAVKKYGHSVLILIDELEQFADLLPLLEAEVGFAHGGATTATKEKIPPDYRKSDPEELVKRFNERKLPILVGTSCIATGTDIQAVKTMIYLRGGRSEIELSQGIGRGTRMFQLGDYTKDSFNFFDFDVCNVPTLHRHTLERIRICKEIYPNVHFIDLEPIDAN